MHLRLAAQTLHIGKKMLLVGTHRTPETLVIGERRTEAEGKHGRQMKALRDDAGMVFRGLLIESVGIVLRMFGDDDGEIARGKEKCLVAEQPADCVQGRRTTMAVQFWERLTFSDAIRVPCHLFRSKNTLPVRRAPSCVVIKKLLPLRILPLSIVAR